MHAAAAAVVATHGHEVRLCRLPRWFVHDMGNIAQTVALSTQYFDRPAPATMMRRAEEKLLRIFESALEGGCPDTQPHFTHLLCAFKTVSDPKQASSHCFECVRVGCAIVSGSIDPTPLASCPVIQSIQHCLVRWAIGAVT